MDRHCLVMKMADGGLGLLFLSSERTFFKSFWLQKLVACPIYVSYQ